MGKEIDDNDPNGARIALCPVCNGLVGVVVNDDISKETNKAYTKLMTLGCTIKYISIAEARKSTFCLTGCEGKKQRKQSLTPKSANKNKEIKL